MRFGIHLPQSGRAAGPDAITRAAQQAEELGFADIWVSDHLAIPADAPYPPAFLYEPIITLTWAAAATRRIGLGTSVLILPYRRPLHMAKELASLDRLSGGRLILGGGAGWLAGEFAGLGVALRQRGRLTDEAIDVMRACWETEGPVSFSGPTIELENLKFQPRPEGRIPIWIGGTSDAALRRAVGRGDGWHANVSDADRLAPLVGRLRSERPEADFTLSTRTSWDGVTQTGSDLRRHAEALAEVGIQHVVAAPAQGTLDDWLRAVELVWEAVADLASNH